MPAKTDTHEAPSAAAPQESGFERDLSDQGSIIPMVEQLKGSLAPLMERRRQYEESGDQRMLKRTEEIIDGISDVLRQLHLEGSGTDDGADADTIVFSDEDRALLGKEDDRFAEDVKLLYSQMRHELIDDDDTTVWGPEDEAKLQAMLDSKDLADASAAFVEDANTSEDEASAVELATPVETRRQRLARRLGEGLNRADKWLRGGRSNEAKRAHRELLGSVMSMAQYEKGSADDGGVSKWDTVIGLLNENPTWGRQELLRELMARQGMQTAEGGDASQLREMIDFVSESNEQTPER